MRLALVITELKIFFYLKEMKSKQWNAGMVNLNGIVHDLYDARGNLAYLNKECMVRI